MNQFMRASLTFIVCVFISFSAHFSKAGEISSTLYGLTQLTFESANAEVIREQIVREPLNISCGARGLVLGQIWVISTLIKRSAETYYLKNHSYQPQPEVKAKLDLASKIALDAEVLSNYGMDRGDACSSERAGKISKESFARATELLGKLLNSIRTF
ncbi:MAG: hypothetical protein AB7F59_11210 [Bdellovibrionales bacterium]